MNNLKIFEGLIKPVVVRRQSTVIYDAITNETQVVRVIVPRGFPSGGTLKTEVSKVDSDFKSIIY